MKFIQSENAPKALGPYSQAVEYNRTLYCSGQIPIDPETNEIIIGSIEEATKQVLSNLNAVWQEAGYKKENVVKCTIFISNMDNFAKINTVYEEFFGDHRPARAVVEVSRLPKDVSIEVESISVK